jgi:hypothetical protein
MTGSGLRKKTLLSIVIGFREWQVTRRDNDDNDDGGGGNDDGGGGNDVVGSDGEPLAVICQSVSRIDRCIDCCTTFLFALHSIVFGFSCLVLVLCLCGTV